jgi:predicted amidohydrolase YtcJ
VSRLVISALGLTSMLAAMLAAQARPATLLVHGGPIYTVNPAQPVVEAVAVRDDRIVGVGSWAEIRRLEGPSTMVLDLDGATLVPGLEDAHGHVLGLGTSLSVLDLVDTPDLAHVVAMVQARVAGTPSGQWIIGRGWDQNDWPAKTWPSRRDLDRVAPDHPVLLTRIDGHAAWVNSRALALAGITQATPDPPGGRIIRDPAGAPTGVLIDGAQQLVAARIPAPDPSEIESRILGADRLLSRVGLTMVHDAGASSSTIATYQRLVAAGRLSTRLYVMIDSSPQTTAEWFVRGPLIDPDDRLTVRAVKMYADGALGSRGAALLEDYSDEPGNRGLLVTPPERLAELTLSAARAGFQPCTHAIGDRANRLVLDIYEHTAQTVPAMGALRPRIEHGQILDAADIPRFGRLGVIASVQPTHCTSDMPWAPARLGAERIAEGAYVWQKLLRSGARLAAGSDFPVERPDPVAGFYAAVTRQDRTGHPPGGWASAQRLSRAEALRAFTLDAAYAAHAERDLGSIETGKFADFVVLSADVMTIPTAEVPGTRVLRTIVAGRTVFQADAPKGSSSR